MGGGALVYILATHSSVLGLYQGDGAAVGSCLGPLEFGFLSLAVLVPWGWHPATETGSAGNSFGNWFSPWELQLLEGAV